MIEVVERSVAPIPGLALSLLLADRTRINIVRDEVWPDLVEAYILSPGGVFDLVASDSIPAAEALARGHVERRGI